MPLNWMNTIRTQPIDSLLLLESCQLSWIPDDFLRSQWALALRSHPYIGWFIAHKCPEKAGWIADLEREAARLPEPGEAQVQSACADILSAFEDWIVYALDPGIYARQPHNGWNERELTDLTDFTGRRVVDVGAGTGKQTFAVAPLAREVYSIEPVGSLRAYLRREAACRNHANVRVMDGLMTSLPLENGFADIIMAGHVFGDNPRGEYDEMMRVLRPGGMLILIPGNSDVDNDAHAFLLEQGCQWARFEEPGDGIKRKYWIEKP